MDISFQNIGQTALLCIGCFKQLASGQLQAATAGEPMLCEVKIQLLAQNIFLKWRRLYDFAYAVDSVPSYLF